MGQPISKFSNGVSVQFDTAPTGGDGYYLYDAECQNLRDNADKVLFFTDKKSAIQAAKHATACPLCGAMLADGVGHKRGHEPKRCATH